MLRELRSHWERSGRVLPFPNKLRWQRTGDRGSREREKKKTAQVKEKTSIRYKQGNEEELGLAPPHPFPLRRLLMEEKQL